MWILSEGRAAFEGQEPQIETVRDSAAIGFGILGDSAEEQQIASVLARPLPPAEDRFDSNAVWRREMDLRSDAALALDRIGTDTAIDDLGRAFVEMIDGIAVRPGKYGGTDYEGTYSVAYDMAVLLGHTQKASVLPYFEAAMAKGKNGETVANIVLPPVDRFPDSPERTKFYHEVIRHGNGAALKEIRSDPVYFDDAVALVENPRTSEDSFRYGLSYFENLNDPRALGPLRKAFDNGLQADSPDSRVALARALTQLGDSLGLADLFSIAKDALATATLPKDPAKRDIEQRHRVHLMDSVRFALQKSYWPEKDLTAFLLPRLESPDPAIRAAPQALLDRLTTIPPDLKRLAEQKEPAVSAKE